MKLTTIDKLLYLIDDSKEVVKTKVFESKEDVKRHLDNIVLSLAYDLEKEQQNLSDAQSKVKDLEELIKNKQLMFEELIKTVK